MHLIALGVVSVRDYIIDYIIVAPCLIVGSLHGRQFGKKHRFRTPSLTKPKDSVNYL